MGETALHCLCHVQGFKNRSQSLLQDSMKSDYILKMVHLLGFQEKVFLLLSLE